MISDSILLTRVSGEDEYLLPAFDAAFQAPRLTEKRSEFWRFLTKDRKGNISGDEDGARPRPSRATEAGSVTNRASPPYRIGGSSSWTKPRVCGTTPLRGFCAHRAFMKIANEGGVIDDSILLTRVSGEDEYLLPAFDAAFQALRLTEKRSEFWRFSTKRGILRIGGESNAAMFRGRPLLQGSTMLALSAERWVLPASFREGLRLRPKWR